MRPIGDEVRSAVLGSSLYGFRSVGGAPPPGDREWRNVGMRSAPSAQPFRRDALRGKDVFFKPDASLFSESPLVVGRIPNFSMGKARAPRIISFRLPLVSRARGGGAPRDDPPYWVNYLSRLLRASRHAVPLAAHGGQRLIVVCHGAVILPGFSAPLTFSVWGAISSSVP